MGNMRLLIYFIALISGFSAAEAARAEVAPASSVAQTAVTAAQALADRHVVDATIPANERPAEPVVAVVQSNAEELTPITRYDQAQE
jgi:hypothetical protein